MSNLLNIIIREMKLRNYSPKTIKAYTAAVKDLYAFYKRSPRELTEEEIKEYLYAKQKRGLSILSGVGGRTHNARFSFAIDKESERGDGKGVGFVGD